MGRSVASSLVVLNWVLAVVGELEERSAFCSLPRSTAQEDPSPCLLVALPLLAAFSAECFAHPRSSGISHHRSWASWLCLSWGPRVAAEWSTPFPACRVCNQLMRTRRMSIHNGSSLAHLRAQVGILSDVTLSFLRAPHVHLGGCWPFLFSFAFMEQLSTATPFPSLPSWCNPYKTVESSHRGLTL